MFLLAYLIPDDDGVEAKPELAMRQAVDSFNKVVAVSRRADSTPSAG
jgi:hypothetical protein